MHRISETPRRVRYHLEKMVEDGVVVVEEERFRPKTIERRYRAALTPAIEELARIHQEAFEKVSSAIASIKARIAAGGEPEMAITSALFLFEVPPWEES